MATNKNTDFLHFNAYSIQELIKRKLTEDSNFTDQVYSGSNLNILIDLVSYMYQCLMYNLNHAASESMFSDTRLYENISRLVKFIGYNPKGLIPSVGSFYFDNTNGKYADKYILKYSQINTKLTDEQGNPLIFSTIEDTHIDSTNTANNFRYKMYNGVWKLYSEVFTASGEDFETFDLSNIASNLSSYSIDRQVGNNMIHVYVEHTDNPNEESEIEQYQVIDTELFTQNDYDQNVVSYARIYTGDDKVVSLRLMEDKTYQIKFGDGTVGKKLKAGDNIYIMYLATNGQYGRLELDDYTQIPTLQHSPALFGMTSTLYNKIFKNSYNAIVSPNSNLDDEILVYLYESTTKPIAEEDVEDIRNNAPEWFKMGQRLVTASDYEYYVKNLRRSEVIDCKVMNNFEYAASFYKWLYDFGVENHSDEGAEYYYLNQNNLLKNNVNWSDPADVNNVYIWTKMADNTSIQTLKSSYISDMQKLKCMTQNIVFLDAVTVNFSVTAMPVDTIISLLQDGTYSSNTDSYIEVTVDSNCSYASSVLAEQINSIIYKYFNSGTLKLGQIVNFNDILDEIYGITGVQKVRTVYVVDDELINQHNGISFATWSSSFLDLGEDLTVSDTARSLEGFQYPVFYDTNLTSRVKVIRKTINSGVRLQY